MGVNILHKELSYDVGGVLFDVHNSAGRFASEKQVCDLIEAQLQTKNILYQRELTLPTILPGEQPGRHRIDFLVDNKIILEIKYRRFLKREDYDQLKRYLVALNMALGILVNFRDERLHPHRVLNGGGKE